MTDAQNAATSTRECRKRAHYCADDVRMRPWSHPVATGWYAEDVPALLDAIEEALHHLDCVELEPSDDGTDWERIEAAKTALEAARGR